MISDNLNMGNILESKALLSKYHPEVLKLRVLSNPPQGSKELTEADLITSEKQLYYFYKTLNNIKHFANENSKLNESIALHGRIIKPDMVNAAKAISQFTQVFKYANALLNNANENPLHKLTTLNKIYENIISAANLLGLFLEEPEVFILEIKEKYINLNHIDMEEVKELMKQTLCVRIVVVPDKKSYPIRGGRQHGLFKKNTGVSHQTDAATQ